MDFQTMPPDLAFYHRANGLSAEGRSSSNCERCKKEHRMTKSQSWSFSLLIVGLALFADVFWFLGYRIDIFDEISSALGWFQLVLLFVCFFVISLIFLPRAIKTNLAIKCFGISFGLMFLWYVQFLILLILLEPFINPWL